MLLLEDGHCLRDHALAACQLRHQEAVHRFAASSLFTLLDLSSLELTKDSFIDAKLRAHYADLLYRLKLKDGAPAFAYVLLEHKRTPQRLTAFQLLC